MKPVLGTPTGTGVGPTGAMATQTPTLKILGKFGLRWILACQDEAARIGQALDPAHGGHAPERRQDHGVGKGKVARLFDAAVLVHLLDRDLSRLDGLDARVDDPLDVAVAHLAFQEALGVADAVQTEMADIGFGCDESHRHLVPDPALAQLGIQDEGEFIGRPEAGRALRRANYDGAGILGEGLEGLVGLLGVIDMADGLGMAIRAQPVGFRRRQDRARSQ